MTYTINGQQVTKNQAENHFVYWCLTVGARVIDVNAISAMRAFNSALRGDKLAMVCVNQSGITVN